MAYMDSHTSAVVPDRSATACLQPAFSTALLCASQWLSLAGLAKQNKHAITGHVLLESRGSMRSMVHRVWAYCKQLALCIKWQLLPSGHYPLNRYSLSIFSMYWLYIFLGRAAGLTAAHLTQGLVYEQVKMRERLALLACMRVRY
jgi:hypothetical protein